MCASNTPALADRKSWRPMSCSACCAEGMPLTPMSMPLLENAADMGAVWGDRLKEARSRAEVCGELGALRKSKGADMPADAPANSQAIISDELQSKS